MKNVYIIVLVTIISLAVIGVITYTVVTNKKSSNNQDTSTNSKDISKKETDTGCSDTKPCPENQTCISGECKTTYFCGNCDPKQAP